jgi:hypothetical protein
VSARRAEQATFAIFGDGGGIDVGETTGWCRVPGRARRTRRRTSGTHGYRPGAFGLRMLAVKTLRFCFGIWWRRAALALNLERHDGIRIITGGPSYPDRDFGRGTT